jgi:hypothetical protein
MPYTDAWTVSFPGGGDPANVDDDMRRLRLDLEERLKQHIVGFDDDTIDPKSLVCRVHHTAGQTITDASPTLIWNTDDEDPNNMHDTAVNNSRITFPIAGRWAFGCSLTMLKDGTQGNIEVFIRKNASVNLSRHSVNILAIGIETAFILDVASFVATDFIEVTADSSSTGTTATIDSTAYFFCYPVSA